MCPLFENGVTGMLVSIGGFRACIFHPNIAEKVICHSFLMPLKPRLKRKEGWNLGCMCMKTITGL